MPRYIALATASRISVRDIDEKLVLIKEGVEPSAILTEDLHYQMKKISKPPTDPRTVVPEEYHDFLDVISKEASDIAAPHCKYD